MAEEEVFDVAIFGTGLTHSLLAVALSPSLKVVHFDSADHYGGYDGNLNLSRLDSTVETTGIDELQPAAAYNLERAPLRLYTASPLIDILRKSRTNEYLSLKALSKFYVLSPSASGGDSDEAGSVLQRVPSSKEDIFTSTTLAPMVKRRLMKLFKTVAAEANDLEWRDFGDRPAGAVLREEFRLDDALVHGVLGGMVGALSSELPFHRAVARIRLHLSSLGLFGDFPAVAIMYGAGAELCQAFCRKAAVKGAVYVLDPRARPPASTAAGHVALGDGTTFKYSEAVTPESGTSSNILRRVLVVDDDLSSVLGMDDTACIAVPRPDSRGYVQCTIANSGLAVCPDGKAVVHMTCSLGHADAQSDLDRAQGSLLSALSATVVASINFRTAGDAESGDTTERHIERAREAYVRIRGSEEGFFDVQESLPEDEDDADAIGVHMA